MGRNITERVWDGQKTQNQKGHTCLHFILGNNHMSQLPCVCMSVNMNMFQNICDWPKCNAT